MRLAVVLAIALFTVTLGASAGGAAGPDFVRITPEQIKWQDVPDSYGAQMATLAGDPAGHGFYVQRVRFPPHVMTRPHWHPNDRYVTVLQGTWYAGTGPTFDPGHAVPMKAGSLMIHPGKAVHWDGSNSDEEVVVQIMGIGPADTTAADPSEPMWAQVKR
jgi:quercetin dioxygenase-like cupin family protein